MKRENCTAKKSSLAIVAIMLVLAVAAACCVCGGVVFSARADESLDEDVKWTIQSGSLTQTYNSETGYTSVGGFTKSSTERFGYLNKVKLDGAVFYMRDKNTQQGGDRMAFMLGNRPDIWWGSRSQGGLSMSMFRGYGGGASVNTAYTAVGIDYGYEIEAASCLAYPTVEDIQAGVVGYGHKSTNARIVTYANPEHETAIAGSACGDWGLSFGFEYINTPIQSSDPENEWSEAGYWKVTVTELYKDIIQSGVHASYQTNDDGYAYLTVYVKKSTLDQVLDENGLCYVVGFGVDRTNHGDMASEYKIEDSLLTDIEEALSDYESLIEGESDILTYYENLSVSKNVTTLVNAVRTNEAIEFKQRLEVCNAAFEAFQPESEEWKSVYGDLTTAYDANADYTIVKGFTNQDGRRAAYYDKIKLDGATITVNDESMLPLGTRFGFMLGAQRDTWYGARGEGGFTFNAFRGWNGGGNVESTQTGVGLDYGYEIETKSRIAYSSVEKLQAGELGYVGSSDSRIVTYTNPEHTAEQGNWGMAVSFRYVAADETVPAYWEVTLKELYAGLIWSTYSPVKGSDNCGSLTYYVADSLLASILDDNGECYVITYAICRNVEQTAAFKVKAEDENTRAADENIPAADAKLTALVGALEDYAQAEDILTAYDELKAATKLLRPNPAVKYGAYVGKYAEQFKSDAALQTYIADSLDSVYTAAENAADMSEITADGIAEAKTALATAETALGGRKEIMSDENIADCDARKAAVEAKIADAEDILEFTAAVSALSEDGTYTQKLAAISTANALYEALTATAKAHDSTVAAYNSFKTYIGQYNSGVTAVNAAYEAAQSRAFEVVSAVLASLAALVLAVAAVKFAVR